MTASHASALWLGVFSLAAVLCVETDLWPRGFRLAAGAFSVVALALAVGLPLALGPGAAVPGVLAALPLLCGAVLFAALAFSVWRRP